MLETLDSRGEHKTSYELEADGSVRTKKLPCGSKLSYGRANDGSVTAITQSTEEGEENSTRRSYTLGVVTEVKSGNNTVEYTYDARGRRLSKKHNADAA